MSKFSGKWKNKKVLVMGLGLVGGGVDAVKWLVTQGAKITVTDLRNKKELKPSLLKLFAWARSYCRSASGASAKARCSHAIKYVLGKHQIKDFINTDLIIKNPAVPSNSLYLKAARKAKIKIETDLSLFFKFYPGQIIGITGTKGKSTTASLIYEILKAAGQKVHLAGNIGSSPLKYLPCHPSNQLTNQPINQETILELSSFQLEDLKVSPQIAVITNLFPDHLNRYKNFREYVKAKEIIFKYQKPNDSLVLNYDNITVRELAKKARAKKYWYSYHKLPATKQGAFVDGGQIYWLAHHKSQPEAGPPRAEMTIAEIKDIKLLGEHNLSNVLAAVTAACIVGVDSKIIREVLKNFAGIPNRLELVATISGVKYINDTTATNPDSAIAGIKACLPQAVNAEKRIILISGGADKNLNFSARGGSASGGKNFVQVIKENCKAVVLLPGTATSKIKNQISKIKNYFLFFEVENMAEAVQKAKNLAERGDIILLSPGCASFGLFKNEFDRGRQFKNSVSEIN